MVRHLIAACLLTAALAACGSSDPRENASPDAGGGAADSGPETVTPEPADAGAPPDAGPTAPVCGQGFVACGGDPVGTWNFDQVCGSEEFEIGLSRTIPECTSFIGTNSWRLLEGKATFRADGTLVYDAKVERLMVFDVSGACLEKLAKRPIDAGVCDSLVRQLTTSTGFLGDCPLNKAGDACHCEVVEMKDDTSTHTWKVDGAKLTISGEVAYDFCAKDDYLVRQFVGTSGLKYSQVLSRLP